MNETLRRPPADVADVVAVIAAALDAPVAVRLATRCDLAEVMKLLDEVNTVHAVTAGEADEAVAAQARHAVDRAAALARVVAELFRRQAGGKAADAAEWLADALASASPAAPFSFGGADVAVEGTLLATIAAGLHDFTTADLRDVELDEVPLTGLRWSSRTLWPEGRREHVEALSVACEPGVFEIRAASRAKVPT